MLDKQIFAGYSRATVAVVAGAVMLGAVAGEADAQTAGKAQSEIAQSGIAQSAASGTAIAAGQVADYQTLYVNATAGNDSSVGVESQPLQTVTRALEIAEPNTIIVLAPGKYTRSSGEVFPLQLKSGVTIQGTPGSRNRTAIIEGGGTFESPTRSQQNAAIIAADRAGIAQVAISNPDGYGVWVESASPTILESAFVGNRQTGIYVASGSPRVQGSYFAGNQIAGLMVFGLSSASIQNNTFDSTGDAIQISDGATPEIVGNRITNNNASLVVIGDANPLLRDNRIMGNRRNDVVAIAARTPAMMSSSAMLNQAPFTKVPEPAAPLVTEPVVSDAEPVISDASAKTPVLSESFPSASSSSTPPPAAAAAAVSDRVSDEPVSIAVISVESTGSTNQNSRAQPIAEPLSQRAEATTYTRVPQAADAIPGELTPKPINRIQPTVRQSFRPTETRFTRVPIPADAVPGELASRSVSPLLSELNESSQLTPEPTGQSIPVTIIPHQPVVIADSSLSNVETNMEADVEANAISADAGTPGSALAALRSGLSTEASASVALRPRAVTGENPDSPVLRPRIRHREPARSPAPSVRPSAPVNNNRLAVPNTRIPLGSGSSSTVFSPPRGGVGSPPAPPSRAQSLGLYYRVFVDAADPFVQDEVKSVVPDAFRTRFEGRIVMQVGAFPTEDEAEDRQQLLEDNDLDAQVKYIR